MTLTSGTAHSANVASGAGTVSLITFDEPNTTFTIFPDNLRTTAGNDMTYDHDLVGEYVFTVTTSLIGLDTYAVGLDSEFEYSSGVNIATNFAVSITSFCELN